MIKPFQGVRSKVKTLNSENGRWNGYGRSWSWHNTVFFDKK